MPELVVDFITSLDGYASAEGWPGWWGLEGPEYLAWLGESPEKDYLVLMGATTYRLMHGFTQSGEPGTDVLTGMAKVAGLVDRFRVVMFPVITGATGSERIYDGYPDVALDMIDSRTFDGRIQLVEYVPRVLDGPPASD
jgi:hypothetical protein